MRPFRSRRADIPLTLDPCSFSNVFGKLIELGVPTAQLPNDKWTMTPLEEQSK